MTINPSSLFPHQSAGAAYIAERDGTLILSDEMGLGKTRTAIASAAMLSAFPCLVVCPAHIKLKWQDEIAEVLPDAKVEVVSGRSGPIGFDADFAIINRDILKDRLEALLAYGFRQLVVDEAHQVGDYTSACFKAFYALSVAVKKQGGGVLLLTGTPVVNSYMDIHRLFCLIDQKVFGTKTAFEAKYCPDLAFKRAIFGGMFSGKPRWMVSKEYADAKRKGLVPKPSDASIAELRGVMRRWSLRRTRSDNWSKLPHTTDIWRVDIVDDELRTADKAARAAMSKGRSHEDGEIATLRRLVAEAKVPCVTEWADNFLEQTGEKLIIMGWHVDACAEIAKHFGKRAVVIKGTAAQKDAAVKRFQTDESVRVCVCNVKAAGTGVTLTAARTILFAEMPWTDADFDQAKARVNRIGQTADSVDYTVCIAAGTVEEIVWRIVGRKKDMTASVMGEK